MNKAKSSPLRKKLSPSKLSLSLPHKYKINCKKYNKCPKEIGLRPKNIDKYELNLIFVGCWGVYCKEGENMLYKPDKKKKKSKDKSKGKTKDGKGKYEKVTYGGKTASNLMIKYSREYNIDAVILAGDNVYSDPYYYEQYSEKFNISDKNKLYLIKKQLNQGYINCYKNIKTDMFLVGIGNHDIETCDILNTQLNFKDDKWILPGLSYVQSFKLEDGTKINLIFIDTNMYDDSPVLCNKNEQYSAKDIKLQEKWLKNILEKEISSWNIVIGHIPFIYNIRKEDSDVYENLNLKAVLNKFKDYIDLYMCADEHNQQYIIDPDTEIPEVISGTGGAVLDETFFAFTEGTEIRRAGFGFVGMNINSDYINLEFILSRQPNIIKSIRRKR